MSADLLPHYKHAHTLKRNCEEADTQEASQQNYELKKTLAFNQVTENSEQENHKG